MYISGQYIQEQCRWNIDNRYPNRTWVGPSVINTGDRVFMKHSDIQLFIDFAKSFPVKVDAVIHNSDESFTDADYERIRPYVRNVYAVNSVSRHAFKIPLGFRDHQYVSHHIMKSIAGGPEVPRTIKCLVNFLISTNVVERQKAFDIFKDKPFCTVQDYVSYDFGKSLNHSLAETMRKRIEFYDTLKKTRFAICPPGTGIDTHRIYECILFGVIPIILSSPLDSIYADMPVWIVRDWNEVTEEALDSCPITPNPSAISEYKLKW